MEFPVHLPLSAFPFDFTTFTVTGRTTCQIHLPLAAPITPTHQQDQESVMTELL